MDWSNFNHHGDAPDCAFEALTGVLFERWCRRELSSQIQQVVFVNGAGGDGGVEAYVKLDDGKLIGLQAKWFREPLGSSQINQIKKSLKTATEVRENLTRYIVTIPRDLSDGKTKKTQQTTECDRWNNFVNQAKIDHPNVTIDLWGETRIAELLAELGSEGLERYWFQGSVADVKYLKLKFEQALNGWLSLRYAPDLHQSGQIEEELKLRLEGLSSLPNWQQETSEVLSLLQEAHEALLRLRRYPEFMELSNAEALIQDSEKWLVRAIEEQTKLEQLVIQRSAFPISNLDNEVTDTGQLRELIRILLSDEGEKRDPQNPKKATDDIGKQLEDALERWDKRKVTHRSLEILGLPILFIGKAGVGKTDAFANSVRKHLAEKKPAILLRARDIDLSSSWDLLLAEAVGQQGWNMRQVLDMLEAAAVHAEIKQVRRSSDESLLKPVRVLVAIDGLDESIKAGRWIEKLGELKPLTLHYPRVLFACSSRPNLGCKNTIKEGWDRLWLDNSDAPLEKIFQAHCNASHIECPPLLRWALGTPLAIRLFADLYSNQKIDSISLQQYSLPALMRQKVNYTEKAIREADEEGWDETIIPVKSSLRAIAKACLSGGQAITQEEALQVVEESQKTKGILSRSQLLRVFQKCRDCGLLLLSSYPSDNPFEDEIYTWETAYETLTDFLLAWEAHDSLKTDLDNPNLPSYLKYRNNAIALTVHLLSQESFNFLNSKLWSNDIKGKERENLQLTAILTMPPSLGSAHRDWVKELLSSSMPSCRRVLKLLIVPGLRIPDFAYGAKFVHNVLLPMQVAQRDIFWSGPNYLPKNHDAPWEGYGGSILEELKIADDDSWDSAPLLLAWATTTVDNQNRRRIRSELALWGSFNPQEMLKLLKAACQTNDPQMKEDLVSALYGASCLTRPDHSWLSLCNWVIDSFLVAQAPLYTHDVIVRNAARGFVERCIVCNVTVDENRLASFRQPYIDAEELLCIDVEAAINVNPHWGIEPATSDLAWYVVPKAIKPFFHEDYSSTENHSVDETDNLDVVDEYEEVSDTLLRKFIEGKLRKSADKKTRQQLREILEARASARSQKGNNVKRKGLSDKVVEQIRESLLDGTFQFQQREPQYSPSAQAFLERYAAEYDIEDLIPFQLAFGAVLAFVSKLGWSREIFIKSPNGGKPNEIMGADIAILREYPQARHGERSSISTFGEKYVWAAVNELLGFFADRIGAYDGYKYIKPPVDLSILAETNNPASDIGYGELPLDKILDFSELIPDIKLSASTQIERALEWTENAPLPQFEDLLLPNSSQLPDWAQNKKWLLLRTFSTRRHIDSQVDSSIWISGFVFPSDQLSILKEDADAKVSRTNYEFYSNLAKVQSYQDPCEAVWISGVQEQEGIIEHFTLDLDGNPLKISLQAASCQFYWQNPDEREANEWIPSKWLRKALNLVDLNAGQFLNASGETVAFTYDISDKPWLISHSQALFVRRDLIAQILEKKGLSLAWAVRVYREPSYPLNVMAKEQGLFRNYQATAFLSNSKIVTISQQDLISCWNKEN